MDETLFHAQRNEWVLRLRMQEQRARDAVATALLPVRHPDATGVYTITTLGD